jgi:hypothetical protein
MLSEASLKKDYWLTLINYWVETRRRTGLTIPFIVGVFNLYLRNGNEDKETVKSLLHSIVNSDIDIPISIFFCDTIGEYVLTTDRMVGIEIRNESLQKITFIISISAEIIGKNIDELVLKFEKKYNENISENKYSKNNLKWTQYNEDDKKLIKEALSIDT